MDVIPTTDKTATIVTSTHYTIILIYSVIDYLASCHTTTILVTITTAKIANIGR